VVDDLLQQPRSSRNDAPAFDVRGRGRLSGRLRRRNGGYALFLEIARISRFANLADVLLLYRMWGDNMTKTKWEAQEADAVRLLRHFLARAFSVELSADDASALRGLSRDEYPHDAAQAARIGSIIDSLVAQFVQRFASQPEDVHAIRVDAGVRLWLPGTDPFDHCRLPQPRWRPARVLSLGSPARWRAA